MAEEEVTTTEAAEATTEEQVVSLGIPPVTDHVPQTPYMGIYCHKHHIWV